MKNTETERKGSEYSAFQSSDLAQGSLKLALFVIVLFILIVSLEPHFGYVELPTVLIVFAVPGCVMGIIAFFMILFSGGKQKKICSAIAGVLLNGLIVGVLVDGLYREERHRNQLSRRKCLKNLRELGLTFLLYSNKYDEQYPEADEWCDLLIQFMRYDYAEENFVCREARRDVMSVIIDPDIDPNYPPGLEFLFEDKKGYLHYGTKVCHYAMNPYCKYDSLPDTVLLFETANGGWNQYGGPELMTFERHGGIGCIVLFNDISAQFVEKKDIGKLRWKVEESEN